jgi:hypothetical protein
VIEETAYNALKAVGVNVWTDLPDDERQYPISSIELVNAQTVDAFRRVESLGVTTYAAKKSEALAEAQLIKDTIEALYERPKVLESVMTDLSYSLLLDPKEHAYMATYDVTVRS